MEATCSCSAGPLKLKFVMWSPCDQECHYPYVDVVMGVIWLANVNVKGLNFSTYMFFLNCYQKIFLYLLKPVI